MPQAEFDFSLREFPVQYVALHSEPPNYPSFQRLMDICPPLRSLHGRVARGMYKAPYPLHDKTFVALAACFSNRQKREILRALILDLLSDDLAALIEPSGREDF